MKKNAGFTLIELMTVIAIIAIMSAVAIPNLIAWRTTHQLNSSAREVQALINGARQEAIKSNATVTVSFDAGAGTIETSVTKRWPADSVPITETNTLRPTVSISAITFADDGFRFNSRGLPINLADNGFASGAITLSGSGGLQLNVVMNRTGGTRIDLVRP